MKFFPILREIRKEHNLTQAQLAEELKIGQRTVSSYENGEREPLASNLITYADFFKVSIDYLVGRADDCGNILIGATSHTTEQFSKTEQEALTILRGLDEELQHRALGYLRQLRDISGAEAKIFPIRDKK